MGKTDCVCGADGRGRRDWKMRLFERSLAPQYRLLTAVKQSHAEAEGSASSGVTLSQRLNNNVALVKTDKRNK